MHCLKLKKKNQKNYANFLFRDQQFTYMYIHQMVLSASMFAKNDCFAFNSYKCNM